ncbi:MAG TPA: 4-hydroxy-tetrahydrodipicolinate reductase [Acidimicrobiales bacterium]|jgi:4-hydroxy-tetrahydrodipicolinate reductase|nr:4-hydroxy-tetrahydrodipicolinate reductase [Acidimicrobiales bacterium]
MIQVGVVGAGGRMGQEVCRAVTAADDLRLVAAVDRSEEAAREGVDALGAAGREVRVTTDLAVLAEAGAQVVVDFSVADAARQTLPWLADRGIHAVVGTTGLGPRDLADLAERFDGSRANAVVAANFAVGAVLLMRFCELAAPHMDGVEIIELHHDRKRDAPSGTALHTATRIAAARSSAGAGALPPDPTTQAVLPGARGGEGPGGVRVHSVRLPGLVAHEEVVFGALGQSLTIRHDSYDRQSFMPGVLLAVRQVPGRPGLTVGLESLLGL